MLGYGVDPLYGEAHTGLGFRVLSGMKLPYEKMNGGYASHFGINPNYFRADSFEGKGMEFKEKIVAPLFYNPANKEIQPVLFLTYPAIQEDIITRLDLESTSL